MSKRSGLRELRAELADLLRDAAALDSTKAVEVLSLPIPSALVAAMERAQRKASPEQNALVLWADVVGDGTEAKIFIVTVQDYADHVDGTSFADTVLPRKTRRP